MPVRGSLARLPPPAAPTLPLQKGMTFHANIQAEDADEAKKQFEALTGRKKPTSTFLAAFRKSAGLETACTNLDKASKADDVKAFANALFILEAKATEYVKALAHECQVAVSHDHIQENPQEAMEDKTYKQCVELLMNRLNKIRKDARENLKKVRH